MIANTGRNFLTKTFDAATPVALDTAVNAWLGAAGEITLVEINFSVGYDGAALVFSTQLLYTK
jgi:hypothetical protein